MSNFQIIFDVTKELYDHLQQPFPTEERESYIEKVELLLLKREELLENIALDSDSIEGNLKQLYVTYDNEINKKLKQVLAEINGDINRLKQKKKTNRKYENLEAPIYTDGVFFDKKN